MKLLLINGSPREKGCTFTALSEISEEVEKQGIDTEIIYIGNLEKANDKSFIKEVSKQVEDSDGLIIGSPVYYAAPTAIISSFMTNLMSKMDSSKLILKPASAIASARRAGTTSTIDQLNKFFSIAQMPVVSSSYWPMVHGNTPSEVKEDKEGLQVMRNLGLNMAWMIKSFDKAKIEKPSREEKIKTNYIR